MPAQPAMRHTTWLGLRPLAAEQRAAPQLIRRAYLTLRFGLCTLFAVNGVNKLLRVLTPQAGDALDLPGAVPFAPHLWTRMAGLAEIAAAVVCAIRPRIGGWVLAGWLAGAQVQVTFDVIVPPTGTSCVPQAPVNRTCFQGTIRVLPGSAS